MVRSCTFCADTAHQNQAFLSKRCYTREAFRTTMVLQRQRKREKLAAAVMLLALLAPFSSALSRLVGQAAQSCSTSCCKGKGTCCCRKRSADPAPGLRWTALASCPPGCATPAGILTLPAGVLAPAVRGPAAAQATSRLVASCLPAVPPSGMACALFGRAPPTC